MTKIIEGKAHREDLKKMQESFLMIEKMAFKYANSNIQHKQVTSVLGKMKQLKSVSENYIKTMRLS